MTDRIRGKVARVMNSREIVITAGGTQNKAALLGRNKQRLLEMQNIVKGFFGKDYRVA